MGRRTKHKSSAKSGPATSATGATPASPSPQRQTKSTLDSQTIALALVLFALVLTLFWSCTRNDFINYDDDVYVTENVHVKSGLTGPSIIWAFQNSEQGNWHPLTWMSHMLDVELHGLKPSGHHLTNIVLHSLNAALVFLVLTLITGSRWRSLAVAALFAAHPLRVESVAWVAERKDVLSTCFWLLTIGAYAGYAQRLKAGKPFRFAYALALLFFVSALMSKSMVVTLPFALLLLDFWPLQRLDRQTWRKLVLEKSPFLALSFVVCVITYLGQRNAGAMGSHLPFSARFETALISCFRYLGKLFWPNALSIHYPYPAQWPMGEVLAAAVGIVAISAVVIGLRNQRPWLAVGWFWYLGTLVPVIGLVQVGLQSMADRYTYIPGLGILIALVWEIAVLWQRSRLPKSVLVAATVLSVSVCAYLTNLQISYWQNGKTIFTHAIAVTTDNEVAYTHLGDYLLKHGEPQPALEAFRKSISIDPQAEEAWTGSSYILFTSGQSDAAIQLLEQGAKAAPDSSAIRNNLGMFYKELGRYDDAVPQLEAALKLRPDYPEAEIGLAAIRLKQGRPGDAIPLLQHAIKSRPELAIAHKLLRQALQDSPQ